MSFSFQADYLEDLKPVLTYFKALGLSDTLSEIDECQMTGCTGGEILSCICASLRRARQNGLSRTVEDAVDEYLRRAGPTF